MEAKNEVIRSTIIDCTAGYFEAKCVITEYEEKIKVIVPYQAGSPYDHRGICLKEKEFTFNKHKNPDECLFFAYCAKNNVIRVVIDDFNSMDIQHVAWNIEPEWLKKWANEQRQQQNK